METAENPSTISMPSKVNADFGKVGRRGTAIPTLHDSPFTNHPPRSHERSYNLRALRVR